MREGDTNGGAATAGSGAGFTEEVVVESESLCSRSYSDMWDIERCVFCGRGELSGGSAGDACAG